MSKLQVPDLFKLPGIYDNYGPSPAFALSPYHSQVITTIHGSILLRKMKYVLVSGGMLPVSDPDLDPTCRRCD